MAKRGKDIFGFALKRGLSYHMQGRGQYVYRFTAGNVVQAKTDADYEFLKSYTAEGGAETPRFVLVDLNKGVVSDKPTTDNKSDVELIPEEYRQDEPSEPALLQSDGERELKSQKGREKQYTEIVEELTAAHLDDEVLNSSISDVCTGARMFLEASTETPLPTPRAIKELRVRIKQDPHERKTLPDEIEEIIEDYEG